MAERCCQVRCQRWRFCKCRHGHDIHSSADGPHGAVDRGRDQLALTRSNLTKPCRGIEVGLCNVNVVGLVLLLMFSHPGSLRGVDSSQIFSPNDVDGLQSLWAAWNSSTPDPHSNLLNWATPLSGETPWPCYDSDKNWRGVTCLRSRLNASQWDTWVVGLRLSDASIAGILPPGISQINKLVTLSLTGNPNLTGSLPIELASLPLNILDLHDNGFTESIPAELSYLGNLLELDLSGNQFVGEFPSQFSSTPTLQVFKIARNLLQGAIPANAFENMTQLLILDLSGNSFTGPSPNFPVINSTLFNLNMSYNNFSGLPELSQVFNGWLPKSLGVLDLSGLSIGGRLPVDWHFSLDLLSLEKLYLNNINIGGVLDINNIQSSLLKLMKASIPSLRTLQVLSLMNNDITDVVFDKQFLKNGQIKFYLQGNPYCTTESKDTDGRRCFCEQYCAISPESPKKSYLKVILITTSICAFLLGSVIFFLFFLLQRKNRHMHTLLKRFDESDVRAKRFEYTELRTATKNFAEDRKLGQGAYGAVYKGILPNNIVVAVKQLSMKTQQASEDFLNEVLLITNLQHRNLVALKGYCLHGKEMLLVYEFVDYCDLDKLLLQGSSVWQEVAWPARMRICLGVAQGLYYLHASSQTKIIHRDIKASNILVDKNLNPKIADFGLARPIEDEKNEILTLQRAGTVGYLAPEYMLYGQLSDKADVFSFGVLLLEIVSGSRNKDLTQPDDEIYLPHRAGKLHKEDRLMEIMDLRLRVTEADAMEVERVLKIAVMCVQSFPENRPTMFRVVAMLAGDADVVVAPMDESDVGPRFNYANYQSTPENPFHSSTGASSSTNGSNSTGPLTNGDATMELNRLYLAQ